MSELSTLALESDYRCVNPALTPYQNELAFLGGPTFGIDPTKPSHDAHDLPDYILLAWAQHHLWRHKSPLSMRLYPIELKHVVAAYIREYGAPE